MSANHENRYLNHQQQYAQILLCKKACCLKKILGNCAKKQKEIRLLTINVDEMYNSDVVMRIIVMFNPDDKP